MEILKYWPLESEPRETQLKTFKFIEENLDKKYIFCELPVGTGKSPVGITLANYLKSINTEKKSSFILTPQKILQKQYEETFGTNNDQFSTLYGKSNYTCQSFNTNCEIGSLTKFKCKNCPSKIALDNAKNSENIVLNYALATIHFNCTKAFEPRNLMILDECHQLENILTEYNTISINKLNCVKFKIPWLNATNFNDAYDWLEEIFFPSFNDIFDDLTEECDKLKEKPKLTDKQISKLKFYNDMSDLHSKVTNFLDLPKNIASTKYIHVIDNYGLKIKHLFGADNFNQIFKPQADKFIFLTATLFDHVEFCNNLGIPLNETCVISTESEFPKENRPVIFKPVMKMSYGWDNQANEKSRQNMINIIKVLLEEHIDENGIIHTGNFQIAKWLVGELKGIKHEVLHHNPDSGDNRDQIVKIFTESKKPVLLISPSITEGLDLVEDKARFAIFAKVSYGPLGDNWIKQRMEMSSNWYLLRALTDVLQGCGRVVRSKDDFGVSYILDSSWSYLYNKTKHKIPQWWLESYHEV